MAKELVRLLAENERLTTNLTAVRTELAVLQSQHAKTVELLAHATEKAVELTARVAELERENKHVKAGAGSRTNKVRNLRKALRQFMRSKEAHIEEMLTELGDRRRLLQEVGRQRKANARLRELLRQARDQLRIGHVRHNRDGSYTAAANPLEAAIEKELGQ